MRIKPGVRIYGLKPETVIGLLIVESVCRDREEIFRLTSGMEGLHGRASLHLAGYAFDMGLVNDSAGLVAELKTCLGKDFDVVLEATHIHVEFQPKEGYVIT